MKPAASLQAVTRRRRLVPALMLLVLAAPLLTLGACAVNPASSNGPSSASYTPYDPAEMENTLKGLLGEQGEGSGLRIDRLNEESCLSRERNEHPETETRWSGLAAGSAPAPEQTHAAMDRMALHLQQDGWELLDEVTNPEDYNGEIRSLIYRKGELTVTVKYENQSAVAKTWEVFIRTPCHQNPEGHLLVRSELDPDYGTPSSIYSDGK